MFRCLVLVLPICLLGCNKADKDRPNVLVEGGDKPAPKKSAYSERLATFKEAIDKGRVSEIRELMKGGADVNDKDDQGQTPLMWAAAKGHRAVLWVLLAGGAIPTERDNQGRTALLLAAEANQPDVVGLLLSPNSALQNAGELITQLGVNPKLTLTASNIEERDMLGQSALVKAAKAGAAPVVTLLISYPHNRRDEVRDIEGRNALMVAAQGGHREIVESLLALQSDAKESLVYVALKGRDGKSALDLAAAHKDVAEILREYAKDPEAVDAQGKSLLMQAIERGDRFVIDNLLRRKVTVRNGDKEGKTPAMYAVEKRDYTTLRAIAFHNYSNYDGVTRNLNIADKEGRTPLMIAALLDDADAIRTMIGSGEEIFGRTGFAEMVVAMNLATDTDGRNALMHAAAKGHEAAVSALLRAYGNMTRADLPGPTLRAELLARTDDMGKTALQIAEANNRKGVVEMLKKNGAKK